MNQTITRTRWQCACDPDESPILLGIYTSDGRCEIKIGDRFYLVSGVVHAACPRCGRQHILDLRGGAA